ncbi:acyl-CoA carboxylase subunit epsilon [Streptomyces sp. GS7]|uniref:acyl-CoA carboxylase subunit epsilon n=1 Tax=Streptomyces sp. GS7 TaxID=2692234 RepID=UPI00131960D6|nr:acyl-CoA carboxylase subunit epsilon [Streptomyces sp. GS7]QHC24074.1 acyl-CoA carboxylase subunit epsilon [Streptomyces sp. GS7]
MTRPTDDPSEIRFRIVRGHAEPEELAALTVILCARFAGTRPVSHEVPDDGLTALRLRDHSARLACWAGCWTCG